MKELTNDLKQLNVRLYEIEYQEKIKALIESGVGKNLNTVGKEALYIGIDILYSRFVDKEKQLEVVEKIEDLSSQLIFLGRQVNDKFKEIMTRTSVNEKVTLSIFNIIIEFVKNNKIDIESVNKGVFAFVPEFYKAYLKEHLDDEEALNGNW